MPTSEMRAATPRTKGTKKATKVKATRKRENASGFYLTSFRRFLHSISPRALAIVSARYGAGGKDPMTLEEIGQVYGITRERVRQIVSVLLGNVRSKRYPAVLDEVSKKIEWTLKKHSGILERENFFDAVCKESASERGAVRFFLAVLPERFRSLESDLMRPSVAIASFPLDEWKVVDRAAFRLFSDNKSSLSKEEFLSRLMKLPEVATFPVETVLDYLSVSRRIAKNPFGQWGLPEWSDICPRGTRERAYLVVRDQKKPLHFREIAAEIDRSGLQKPGRVTHPQTVHNELIKDKRFVLVGRGTYALVEWGFRRGTVREVIEGILKEAGKPLSREVIIAEVLKVRDVKASTVVINLNSFFARMKNGTFSTKGHMA